MEPFRSDLEVELISGSLMGRRCDWIVSGSVGAVETPRLIRSLRRLGVDVQPFMTHGAASFITETSLHWASTHSPITAFQGSAKHLAERDFLVVAPASAQFLVKVSHGYGDDPASCLAQSYMGQKKPIFILPAMHGSLALSPGFLEAREKLERYATFLSPRSEEGKWKVGDPDVIADTVSHQFCKSLRTLPNALLNMGTTRGYLDAVRYISNYSSGRLGSLLTEELHRCGIDTTVVSGPCEFRPRASSSLISVETVDELKDACLDAYGRIAPQGLFCLASVLDYVPAKKVSGKLRSGEENLAVEFRKTEKILASLKPLPKQFRVACKLESEVNQQDLTRLRESYIANYTLSGLLVNQREQVSANSHAATWLDNSGSAKDLRSKQEIAQFICQKFLAHSSSLQN